MQRFMSYDPRSARSDVGASEATLACRRFHASRIHRRQKLTERLDRLEVDLCPGVCDRNILEGIRVIVDALDELSGESVDMADRLTRIGEEADRIRHQFRRYRNSGSGLSPGVPEEEEGGATSAMDSSLDDLSVSPATIPRTADVALEPKPPRFPASDRSFWRPNSHFTGFLFPSSSSSSSFPPSTLTLPPSGRSDLRGRDLRIGGNQTAGCGSINLGGSHSIFESSSRAEVPKYAGRRGGEAVNEENKISRRVEILVSDYDDKPPNDRKSVVKFESPSSREATIAGDLRARGRHSAEFPGISSGGESRGRREANDDDDAEKRTKAKEIRHEKATATGSAKTTATRIREIEDRLSEMNGTDPTRPKRPPQVPVKRLTLSAIKRTNTKEQP